VTAAVVTWGGSAMPDGVTITPGESAYYMTRREAERRTAEVKGHLSDAVIGLQVLRAGHAHLALGYEFWHEYVEHEFGDVRELRLPADERRALVHSMCEAGYSVRKIREAIGFSVGTIQADRVALGYGKAPDVLEHAEPLPAPTGTLYDQAAEHLARQGDRGLTIRELMHEAGWEWQRASGVLSRLHHKKRRCAPTGGFRLGLSVYVATVEP
jgi:hypothetical protein